MNSHLGCASQQTLTSIHCSDIWSCSSGDGEHRVLCAQEC